MTFPQTATPTVTGDGSDSTTHNVTMPPSLDSGDLILSFMATDNSPTITTPSGWTHIVTSTYAYGAQVAVYAKVSDGTEDGASVNFATNNSERAVSHVYRIASWEGMISSVEGAGVSGGGSNTTPDPPSLSPSWGAEDTLWFAAEGNDSTETVTAYPTNYSNGVNNSSGGSASGKCGVGTARREYNASSDNPGTFTINSSEQWGAVTVAVRPASGGGTDELTPDDLATGSPTLDTPAIGQTHVLTGGDLAVSSPTLSTPSLGQVHALTGDDLTTAPPSIDTPAIGQIHGLLADDLATTAPTMDTPAIGQVHSLTADDVATASPILGTPVLGTGGTDDLTPNDLATASPTLSSPALGQVHALSADDIETASPTLDTPTIGQIHGLTADDVTTATPSLISPAIGQIHVLTPLDLVAGLPALGNPSVGQIHGLTPTDLATASPSLSSPALTSGLPFNFTNQNIMFTEAIRVVLFTEEERALVFSEPLRGVLFTEAERTVSEQVKRTVEFNE